MSKEKIIQLLNHALELEYSAYVQYLSHLKNVKGKISKPIISRIKEIAGDEKRHQDIFKKLIALLGGVPSMKIAPTHPAKEVKEILSINLKDEKTAVDTYRKILTELKREKQGYYDYLLEHDVRHILMEEEEHITELELLQGTQGKSY